MSVIVTIEADNKIYLLTVNNGVNDFETVAKARHYFESSYRKRHSLSYESSISVVLNHMAYQPSIHEWNHNDLSPMIEMGIIEEENFHEYGLSHVSGHMTGGLCTGENAKEFHDKGIKPRLI
jgi:hypothetical protein